MSALAERLARVDEEVAAAAAAVGRAPAELTRIVVTKFQPAQLVAELAELGVSDVGENRAQELAAKRAQLPGLRVRWHFLGQLQRNKVRQVVEHADVVHSVDREQLVDALAAAVAASEHWRGLGPLDVFIQLDLSGDPGRGGVDPAALEPLAEAVLASPSLRLLGLMAVAPLGEPPAAAFARLASAAARLTRLAPEATALSAGMSGDFREAIAAGATHLRIGSAITGERPPAG